MVEYYKVNFFFFLQNTQKLVNYVKTRGITIPGPQYCTHAQVVSYEPNPRTHKPKKRKEK